MPLYWNANMATAQPSWWAFFKGRDLVALQAADVGSPLWMLYRGLFQIGSQHTILTELEDYWQGRHRFPDTLDDETKTRYRVLVERSRINYMRTVVEVIAERLKVQGLWIPGDDERADSETWALWTQNDLDSWQSVAFAEMVAKRRVYWSVWPAAGGAPPRIELEDALATWVENQPGRRRERAFGVKAYTDEWTGREAAEVVTPEAVHYFTRSGDQFKPRDTDPTLSHDLGEVPFVCMANRPTLNTAATGYSVLEDVIETQDRINQTILGRMLAGHTAAFLQKWATGIEIEDDADGKPVPPYIPGVTRLWTSEDQNAKFGQFDSTDLRNYIEGEEQDIQHIANTTRIPRHYLNPTGQAPSGDAMRSAEASLVATVNTIQQFSGTPLKAVLRLARKAAGLGDTPFDSELVWADPEFQTWGQLVDGTLKLTQGRIASLRYAREKVGMSPATITRVEAELEQEALLAIALGEPVDEEPAPVAEAV